MKHSILKKVAIILAVSLVLPLSGCKTFDDAVVIHDELFTYDVTYDQAFMMVIEAVNGAKGWKLAGIDKRKGTVAAYNEKFMSDDRVVVLVKRITRGKTSVELDPDSQSIKGVEIILKAIDKKFMP